MGDESPSQRLNQTPTSKSKFLATWVSTSIDLDDKVAAYEELRHLNSEGIVFKEIDAPHTPGRPASGGSQLKYKFVETASFIVTGINQTRSVSLGLYRDEGEGNERSSEVLLPAGNVTIPPNKAVPKVGTVVEVRFLYAFPESGSIYQPVYLQERNDIPATDCTTDQLKYKPEPAPA
jgi:bifunctional non-homologous end joining protein LigD